jgi:hypothetical protein
MAVQRILYLTAEGLTAFIVERGQIRSAPIFVIGEKGFAAFQAYLQECPPDAPLSLLVDLPDENHQRESVPFVRGRDRQPMLARRLNQLFGDTPYRTYLSLGREAEGRRDELILFAALTRPAAIQPWLERIRQSPCILTRMVSAPFLSRNLLPSKPALPAPFLLAHLTPAGLRVSCFDKGHLRFSRLTTLKSGGSSPSGNILRTEIQRSFDYLAGQRILPRNGRTTARIIAAPEIAADFPGGESPENGLVFELQDPVQITQTLRLHSKLASSDSLPLLLQALAANPGLPQFAPADALTGHRLQRVGHAISATGAVALLVSLGIATSNLIDARAQRLLTENTIEQIRRQDLHLKAVSDAIPATPVPLDQLQRSVSSAKGLAASTSGPEAGLRLLAAALAPLPDFQLLHMEWALIEPVSDSLANAQPTQMLGLHFALPAGSENARSRVAQAEALLAALRGMRDAEVSIEKQPAEMNDAQALRLAELQSGAGVPQLAVRIQLPMPRP